MLKNNSRGVTLLEAFLAAFIFVIATAAIFATLNSLRKPAVNNEQAIGAALAGRTVLEDLRSKIDTRDIDAATGDYALDLKEGGPIDCPSKGSSDFHCRWIGNYKVQWTVTCVDSSDNPVSPCVLDSIRKVEAAVSWTDAV